MPTPVKPRYLARKAGLNPIAFVRAVQDGESEYNGLPIASWRQDGGAYLNIPDEYADHLGIGPKKERESRPNPSEQPFGEYGQKTPPTGWPDAVRESAPPVSANFSAAYTMGRFADTVAKQPQIMEDVADAAALLGSAGLAYATTKEGDVLKAGATTVGVFAAFKILRYACREKSPTGMQGQRRMQKQRQQQRPMQKQRQQQRPMQKQRQQQRPMQKQRQQNQLQATDQKRLAHRSATTLNA